MQCGCTYLLYDEEDAKVPPHLHIQITDPDANDLIVLVSVTTERAKSDTMVRIAAGEHPFVQHPSVVTYAYSKLLTCAQLKAMIEADDAVPKKPASNELVKRAQNGMKETDRAPAEVQGFFIAWMAAVQNAT